ncbi:hypothetical protein AAFF_G00041200 [Aldrovandia affinis]|uniref:Uncharacterized protein n=1 Tax=Aldrovandia affinis TaxID=143900 RepID=A0AAD7S2E9_9TELE|nr:hypothetical protein AAFF_G00041200 [Aldrovandia affinis]
MCLSFAAGALTPTERTRLVLNRHCDSVRCIRHTGRETQRHRAERRRDQRLKSRSASRESGDTYERNLQGPPHPTLPPETPPTSGDCSERRQDALQTTDAAVPHRTLPLPLPSSSSSSREQTRRACRLPLWAPRRSRECEQTDSSPLSCLTPPSSAAALQLSSAHTRQGAVHTSCQSAERCAVGWAPRSAVIDQSHTAEPPALLSDPRIGEELAATVNTSTLFPHDLRTPPAEPLQMKAAQPERPTTHRVSHDCQRLYRGRLPPPPSPAETAPQPEPRSGLMLPGWVCSGGADILLTANVPAYKNSVGASALALLRRGPAGLSTLATGLP